MRMWIKLHTVILSDYKLCGMSDHLFRTTINLLAVAGFEDREGELGTVESIAFHLRRDVAGVNKDLAALAKISMVKCKNGVWFLTNWDKFQAPKPPSARPEAVKQRVRKSRDTRKNKPNADGNEDVTMDVTTLHDENVTKTEENREEERREEETEKSPPPPNPTADIQSAYEDLLGQKLTHAEWVKQEATAAKTIGERYTVAQLRAAYEHYKSQPFWSDKRLTLNYLAKNMPELLAHGRKPIIAGKAKADNGMKGWSKPG